MEMMTNSHDIASRRLGLRLRKFFARFYIKRVTGNWEPVTDHVTFSATSQSYVKLDSDFSIVLASQWRRNHLDHQ